jgi:hypothetical protein
MSVLDRGGRIADRAVVKALGWTPGTRLQLEAAHTHLKLRAAIDGALAMKGHRYLASRPDPAPTRSSARRSGAAGRATGAADTCHLPTAALDQLLTHRRSASDGGGRDE